ncbi:MAG: response regulator [Synergistaceae bacterium]|nr:response regulator [Synergistaceae bacterium]
MKETFSKPLILAIDDAVIMLETIIAALGTDYKVYGMADPMKLEKVLQNLTPDLFLLDYNMPGRGGPELVPVIRSFEKHKDTPIIFVTSMRTFDHLSAAVALGACDFVAKPIKPDILREKVAKHI